MAASDRSIGVIIEEVKIEAFQINAVDISSLCVFSKFERGPINKATEVGSFDQFTRIFGAFVEDFEGWLQVWAFFELYNGRRAVIVRVAHYTDITLHATLTAVAADAELDDNEAIQADLAAGIDAVVTTLTVDPGEGAAFPATPGPGVYLLIGTEQITYTSRTVDTFNGLGRGANGSVAAAHLAGDDVIYVEPAHGLIVTAKDEGAFGNDLEIEVLESSKIDTELTVTLASGAEYAELVNVGGIEPGDVLKFDDTITVGYVMVSLVDGNRVYFTEPLLLSVAITAPADVTSLHNDINVYFRGQLVEQWPLVAMWPDNAQDFVESNINGNSDWISVDVDEANQAALFWQQQLAATSSNVPLTSGSDGGALTDVDFVGSPDTNTGLYTLEGYKLPLVLTQPDATTVSVQRATAAYAESKIIHFFLMDIPHGLSVTGVQTYVDRTVGLNSSFVAAYWPNIYVQSPVTQQNTLIHPSGSIVGRWAVTTGPGGPGPWQASAGTTFGTTEGIVDVEKALWKGKLEIATNFDEVVTLLQESYVNSIQFSDEFGFILWGCRTMDRTRETDPNAFPFINQREMFRFVEASFKRSFIQALFRNNDQNTRSRIFGQASSFLTDMFNKGAFPGETTTDSFLVICNRSNNTDEIIKQGEVRLKVQMAKPSPINRARIQFSALEFVGTITA